MGLVDMLLVRLFLWFTLPALFVLLLFGPRTVWGWGRKAIGWLRNAVHEPSVVLDRVVRQHRQHIDATRKALAQAEATRADVERHRQQCEEAVKALEADAERIAHAGDDLEAKAALFKMNLERLAAQGFAEQLVRQDERMVAARKRLHLLELQLRQYEVGRSVLLSQLAEAKTVEQQYRLAQQFDPFSAVATWQREEGLIAEKSQQALAAEQSLERSDDVPLVSSTEIDPALLDRQLAELKSRHTSPTPTTHYRATGTNGHL